MTPFPRADYRRFQRYTVDRPPVRVDLSDNTNRWGAHPDAVDAVRSAPPEAFTRYPTLYANELRAEVGRRYGVDPSCVTTGCGADDVLDSAVRAAARPPGLLCYASPTFAMAEVVARMNGLETAPVPWPRAIDDPGRLLEPDPEVVYVCSPNNPTGASLPDGWLGELLYRAGSDGPLVILDEAYADFEGKTRALLAVERGRTIVVRTLSKLFALAGVRVGYGIGKAEVIDQIEKSRGPYKVSGIAERAAVAALRDSSGWAERVLAEAVANRARLLDRLRARGLSPLPSAANFVLVPVSPWTTDQVVSTLRRQGVAVRGFPNLEGVGDAIRVTVGPASDMELFFAALDRVLDA